MFGRLPCLYDSWLTFARNETPQAALNECTCQYCPILFNSFILLIYDDIRKKGNISVRVTFSSIASNSWTRGPRMSWQYVDCPGLTSRHTHPSIPQQFTQLQPRTQPLLNLFWLMKCALHACKADSNASSWCQEASNPPAFASAFLASRESWMSGHCWPVVFCDLWVLKPSNS